MTQEVTPSQVEVTQADREAAAKWLNGHPQGFSAAELSLVQAFAAHRARFEEQTRTATEREVVAKALQDYTTLDRVADAITRAACPGREGPYGGYDYGHNEEFYGEAPKGGRYVVRDYRDLNSPTFGAWVHQTDDREAHEQMFRLLTARHIASAAIRALSEQKA